MREKEKERGRKRVLRRVEVNFVVQGEEEERRRRGGEEERRKRDERKRAHTTDPETISLSNPKERIRGASG